MWEDQKRAQSFINRYRLGTTAQKRAFLREQQPALRKGESTRDIEASYLDFLRRWR